MREKTFIFFLYIVYIIYAPCNNTRKFHDSRNAVIIRAFYELIKRTLLFFHMYHRFFPRTCLQYKYTIYKMLYTRVTLYSFIFILFIIQVYLLSYI